MERKLAAIMFTDIAGFTALSAQDENKALKILKIQESTSFMYKLVVDEYNKVFK